MPVGRKVDLSDATLFGDPDARSRIEQEGLRSYFLEPQGYSNIILGHKSIIVGRKGTGKTAIRTKLLEKWDDTLKIDIDPLPPNHLIFDEYAKMVEGGGEPSFSTYELVWRAYSVSSVLRHLMLRNILGFGEKKTFLGLTAGLVQPTQQDAIWTRVNELSLSIGSVSANIGLSPSDIQRALPTEAEISILIEIIARAAARTNNRIVALIDRIDQQLEQPLNGRLFHKYAKYLGGACLACARLCSQLPAAYFSMYVFAREDLLDEFRIVLHNSTEFEGSIFRLSWRMDHLMDMVACRIATHRGIEFDICWDYELKREFFFSNDLFHAVFDRIRPDGMTLWRYLLCHTHMRPRDMINICNACRDEASQSSKRTIDGASLNRGIHDYSTWKYNDLVSTYRWMITAFHALIDSFRGTSFSFSRQEMLKHLDEANAEHTIVDITLDHPPLSNSEHLLQVLYKTGFIVSPKADESSLPFVAHYIEPNLAVSKVQRWLIHPAYVRELQDGHDPFSVKAYLGIE